MTKMSESTEAREKAVETSPTATRQVKAIANRSKSFKVVSDGAEAKSRLCHQPAECNL